MGWDWGRNAGIMEPGINSVLPGTAQVLSNIQQAGIRKCGCFSWVSLTNKELEEYTLWSHMDTSELVSLWMVWLKEDIEEKTWVDLDEEWNE